MLPFKEFFHFTEQKAKKIKIKKYNGMSGHRNKNRVSQWGFRGSQSASESDLFAMYVQPYMAFDSVSASVNLTLYLYQLFWCLPLVILTMGGGSSNWKLVFHFKAQIHKSNINCLVGEN